MLLVFIALILLVSLGVTALYASTFGTKNMGSQIVRFVLTVGLCYWLYSGSKAAKWITVALMMTAGVFSLGALLTIAATAITSPIFIGMAAIYLSFSAVLILSSSVNAFLGFQRGEPPGAGQ